MPSKNAAFTLPADDLSRLHVIAQLTVAAASLAPRAHNTDEAIHTALEIYERLWESFTPPDKGQ